MVFLPHFTAKYYIYFWKCCRKYLLFHFLCSEENKHLSGVAACFVVWDVAGRLGFYVFLLTSEERLWKKLKQRMVLFS